MLPLVLSALFVPWPPLPVPADSLVVVQLRGLAAARERVAGLLRAVAPDKAAEALARLDALLQDAGADRLPVDPARRAFLAVLPAGAEVAWAAYLPARDFGRFGAVAGPAYGRVEWGNGPLFLLGRTAGGYVVATPSEPLARRLVADPAPLPATSMGAAAGVFWQADLGVWVNLPAVHARYAGLLAGTRFALPRMLTSGAFGLPKLDARQAGQVATVANAVVQTVADGTGLAVGVRLGPAGVAVEAALTVRPNTASAKLLAGERPSALALLDALPGGQSAYAAAALGLPLATALRDAFPEFQPPPGPVPPAVARALDRLGVRQQWATAGDAAGATLELSRPAGDPAALPALVGLIPTGGAHKNVPLRLPPALARGAERVGGLTFDRLTVAYDLAAATAAVADDGLRQAAHTAIEKLVGDHADVWLAARPGQDVRVTAADWPAARRLVQTFLDGSFHAADDGAVRAVRRRLPAEASAVVLLDAALVTCRAGELITGVVDALPAVPGLELPGFVPPAGRSPLLGVAVVARPGGVTARLELPAEALRAAVGCVKVE